jgi:hypothetical protein
MKYVFIEVSMDDGMVQMLPVIFPNSLVHEDVSKAICRLVRGAKPVSAGFINMRADATYDKSETLQLSSREEDAAVINFIDYMQMRDSNG